MGIKHNKFAMRLGVVNSYMSEIYHLPRLYNPKYCLLNEVASKFDVNVLWLTNPEILPSEIVSYCPEFLIAHADKGILLRYRNSIEEYKRVESETRAQFQQEFGIYEDHLATLEKFFEPIKMIRK